MTFDLGYQRYERRPDGWMCTGLDDDGQPVGGWRAADDVLIEAFLAFQRRIAVLESAVREFEEADTNRLTIDPEYWVAALAGLRAALGEKQRSGGRHD